MPRTLVAALLALSILVSGPQAFAQEVMAVGDMVDKPLMIIRFNQPRVYFGKQLSLAVGKAEKVKPDIVYEVTSYVPSNFNPKQARANLQAVIGGMQMYGADISRIRWRSETAASSTQEIYINVE